MAEPPLAVEFVGRKAPQGHEPLVEVVSGGEVTEKPLMDVIVAVKASDSGILGGPLYLSIRPRAHRLGQSTLDIEIGTSRTKGVAAEEKTSAGQPTN